MRAWTKTRSCVRRAVGLLAPVLAGGAVACSDDFDNSRSVPPRGTLGEELFGVMCDRVGAQSLHEDLSGASFRDVCHKRNDRTFADKVDLAMLPALEDGRPDRDGKPVPLAKQQADRAYGVARVETLGKHRASLVAALDAAFPEVQVPLEDLGNADPTKSCSAPAGAGMGPLHHELADLLARMQDLYVDGTIPQTTEALARVVDAFKASPDAQAAWARFDARAGYRPIDVAIGAARPVLAYPGLRDFVVATTKLLSVDSDPYAPGAPAAGSAYAQMSALLATAHAELGNSTADAPIAALSVTTDPATGRTILSRPRTDLEMMQSILYAQDPTFGGGTSRYIVQRDTRGFAALAGPVVAPFVDKDGDGLPDVDDLGRFVTADGQPAPSPFFAIGARDALARDTGGRALDAPGGKPVYAYLDTSHTYTTSLLHDLGPLLDSDQSHAHETVMDLMAGAYVLFGARAGTPNASRTYADGTRVDYDAFHTDSSALLDLVYAFGQILSDPTADDTLSFTSALVREHTSDVARITGDGLYAKGIADKHAEAKIPSKSTLWDEMIDVTIQIEKEPGLLEDVLRALGDDASLPLATSFSAYMANRDHVSYDRNDLNGPAFDVTTNDGSEPKTLVDRSQPDTGDNRSEMQRFLAAIHDTHGVTACNKDGAVVHARGVPILGNVDLPLGGGSYSECEVFKIDDLARFYLDAIVGKASMYFRPDIMRNGIFGIGAATVDLIENSSGIGSGNGSDPLGVGFWDGGGSKTFRPKPPWLNRLVFFDLAGDSPNPGDKNYITNHFLTDLQGPHIGTSVCPERIIPDPCFNNGCGGNQAAGVSPDGLVHGLRACDGGDWAFQRDLDATFVWEDFGFYRAITPLVSAFADHGREDLFIALMEALHRHWQTEKGTASECKLGVDPQTNQTLSCTKDGAGSYEALNAEIFASDMLSALHDLVKTIEGMNLATCDEVDAQTHACTKPSTKNGISILADATRALVDPERAKFLGWTDRKGGVTSVRNDGTTNPQVTPLYLVLEALNGIDEAFAAYAQAHSQDAQRQAQWRRARSQLVDQFLGVSGQNTPAAAFTNAAMPKVAPVLLDALRAQLFAHCPPPYGACDWARKELTANMAATIGGPTFAATVDVTESIRKDDAARAETEKLLAHLVDAASSNDALAEMLSSVDDLVQVLRDDTNLVPVYKVLAVAVAASQKDASGNERRNAVDATLALFARMAGRARDASGTELCSKEVDPEAVLNVALAHLVTPMVDAAGRPSETPLEVILDAIADVNRASPGAPDKRNGADYANAANELSEFLLDDQRGLEQFYAIVRNGTTSE